MVTIKRTGANQVNTNRRHLFGSRKTGGLLVILNSIAHELKNYLAIINLNSELSAQQLGNIKETVQNVNCLLQELQLQMKAIATGKPEKQQFKTCSLANDIQEALKQYPFNNDEERRLITLKLKDFKYFGSPILTYHILANLLKNSLRAIKNAEKGIITIKSEEMEKFNQLIIRDTATGIPKKFLPKMFNLFASQMTAQGGSGIGLAFCQLIMQAYGGEISCNSIEGEYTEFVLKFPQVK